jgi:hypothetical protein
MRLQATATTPELSQQMGQLMEECPLNLHLGNLAQRRIKPDLPAGRDGHTGGRPHAGIPTNEKSGGKFWSQGMDRLLCPLFQIGITIFGTPATNHRR